MSRRIVIIGHGMAGGRLVEKLVEYGWDGQITIIGEEPESYYNRVNILDLIDGSVRPEELNFQDTTYYRDHGINRINSVRVVKIDHSSQSLTLSDNRNIAYDYLVFATGASPRFPELPGMEEVDWHVLRNLSDIQRLEKSLENKTRFCIVGGGLIGLEVAEALRTRNIEVTLVLRGERILRRLFPQDAAEIYQKKLEELGVNILTGAAPLSFSLAQDSSLLQLSNGAEVEADSFIFAMGIQPNVSVAAQAGIPTANGIIVNEKLESALEGIYAIGEAAEVHGRIWDVVSDIWKQADILAQNLCGADVQFDTSHAPLIRPKASIPMLSLTTANSTAVESAKHRVRIQQTGEKDFISLRADGGSLSSAYIVGNSKACAAIEAAYSADQSIESYSQLHEIIDGRSSWPDNFVICDCFNISTGRVKQAIEEEGATSIGDLGKILSIGKACGSCYSRIETILEDTLENYDASQDAGTKSLMGRLRTKEVKGFTLFSIASYFVDINILISGILVMLTGILKFPELISVRLMRRLPLGLFQFIHDWGGLWFTLFSAIHIIMHWNMIVNFIRQMLSRPKPGVQE